MHEFALPELRRLRSPLFAISLSARRAAALNSPDGFRQILIGER
jgi:hypothetical protein